MIIFAICSTFLCELLVPVQPKQPFIIFKKRHFTFNFTEIRDVSLVSLKAAGNTSEFEILFYIGTLKSTKAEPVYFDIISVYFHQLKNRVCVFFHIKLYTIY